MKKEMWKRWVSLALIVVMLLSSVTSVLANEQDNTWKDIQSYYPFSSWAVDVGTKYKIIFLENNRRVATRAEVANLLFNLTSVEKVTNGGKTFSDINDINEELNNRIQKMSQLGIISGYADGTFKPMNPVTRAEFAAMICRTDLLESNKISTNVNFEDISNHWAKEDINQISAAGIVSGKGDNKFCPEDGITPQELVIILDKLVNIGSISKEKLISTMLDTFKCKQYSDKEQYVIEVMYSDFDKIQNFMKYDFPYKDFYDYINWQDFATTEDIQYVVYFMMSRKTKVEDDEEKRIFDSIGNIVKQNNRQGKKCYTIADMLHIINKSQTPTQIATLSLFDYYDSVRFNYTNISSINAIDLQQLKEVLIKKENTMFDNVKMEFPIDAPVTKYMLNYLAMEIEETYKGYRASWTLPFYRYLGEEVEEVFATSEAEMPSNYAEFPYIVKNVPKEIYEKPYKYQNGFPVRKPNECYYKYSKAMDRAGKYVRKLYDITLNIDYRNLNEERVKSDLSDCFYYISDEEIQDYINYVKENEIILKGSGFAVPGTVYISDGTIYVRTVLQFEVVSAKEMKNLLFGDLKMEVPQDITYSAKEYTICSDIGMQGGPIFWNGELRFDIYKLLPEPVLYGSYWKGIPTNFNLPQ